MYSLLPAFVSAVFLGFSLYVLAKEGVTRVSLPLVALCMITCIWQGTWAALFQTTSSSRAVVLAKIGYLFIAFLPAAFYHFVIELVPSRRDIPWLLASYGLSALLAVLVIATNEVVNGVSIHSFGYYPRAGRLHPVHVALSIALSARCAWLLLREKRRASASIYRDLFNPCLVSLGVYCLAGTDYAVSYGCDFYPLSVIFVAICPALFAVAIEERERDRSVGQPDV